MTNTCIDGACRIATPAELKSRTAIQSFWHFVRKNNVEVVLRFGRLHITLNGCNIDAFCAEYGNQNITCKVMDNALFVDVRGMIGENLTQDEIVAGCGDWKIKEEVIH